MFTHLFDYLYGYERLRHRGDRLFLSGEFERARAEYSRARAVLREGDNRATTIEALLRECDALAGLRASSGVVYSVVAPDAPDVDEVPGNTEEGGFYPGIDDLFELAIADKPRGRVDAYRVLGDDFKAGYVALVQGSAERAVGFLAASAKEGSASFVVNLELGRAWSLAGRMDEAREALKLAEHSAPSDVEVGVLLSAVNIDLGRFDEARERLEVLARDESDDPDITFLLGRSLAGAKKSDAALEKFRETVKKEPRFHEAYFEAADVLRRRGDSEAAFELLNRACHLAPDEIRYNRELAELVLSDGHDEEAGLAACDRLMVNDEDNAWQYLKWIAELYIRRGFIREARDPLQKALNLVPRDRATERMEIERRLSALYQKFVT